MITAYIDALIDEDSLEKVRKDFHPPFLVVNAVSGFMGYKLDNEQKFPFIVGKTLNSYAAEKRYGIVEPGVLAEGCVVPDVLLTKEDLENIERGWLW